MLAISCKQCRKVLQRGSSKIHNMHDIVEWRIGNFRITQWVAFKKRFRLRTAINNSWDRRRLESQKPHFHRLDCGYGESFCKLSTFSDYSFHSLTDFSPLVQMCCEANNWEGWHSKFGKNYDLTSLICPPFTSYIKAWRMQCAEMSHISPMALVDVY